MYLVFLIGIIITNTGLFSHVSVANQNDLSNILEYQESERFFGVNPKEAKSQIVYYGSITCHHCSTTFMSILPKLRNQYIMKGRKVTLIHRLATKNALDLLIYELLNCAAKELDDEKFFQLLYILYAKQSYFATSDYRTKIYGIAKTFGINAEKINACSSSSEQMLNIVHNQQKFISTINDSSTPAVFVDGRRVYGVPQVFEFVNAKLA